MLKKTITYTDFEGNEKSEDFYFHLSKAELIEMNLSTKGGYSEKIQNIIEAEDGAEIMRIIKDIVLSSYGIKTPDGMWYKDNTETRKFQYSEAYSELITELCTDANAASAFINGIIPVDIAKKIANTTELPPKT